MQRDTAAQYTTQHSMMHTIELRSVATIPKGREGKKDGVENAENMNQETRSRLGDCTQ